MEINIGGNKIVMHAEAPGITMRQYMLTDGRVRLILEETEKLFGSMKSFADHCSENDLFPIHWPFEKKDLMKLNIDFLG